MQQIELFWSVRVCPLRKDCCFWHCDIHGKKKYAVPVRNKGLLCNCVRTCSLPTPQCHPQRPAGSTIYLCMHLPNAFCLWIMTFNDLNKCILITCSRMLCKNTMKAWFHKKKMLKGRVGEKLNIWTSLNQDTFLPCLQYNLDRLWIPGDPGYWR